MNERIDGISIVIPFLNESEGILDCCSAMDAYAASVGFPIEVVFVNDGSTDDSSAKVGQFRFRSIEKVKLIELSKNYGSHAAIRAGLKHASYGTCTWMGSDLQDPIEFIALAREKLAEGYDAVYIEKKSIEISVASRAFSKLYSWLMRKFAVKNYSSGGVNNIVFNEKVKRLLNENVETNSSLMLQIIDAGFRNITIPMAYKERNAGRSKWTLSKKIKLFIDSFVAFSFMPLRLVSMIGIAMFLVGVLIGIITLYNKITNPLVPVGYSTIASILALGFGITNISLGIIAEYLWRAYDAARGRPAFIISEIKTIVDKEALYDGESA